MKQHHDRPEQLKRLARVRGQVDGIARMIEDDRNGADILMQLRAVRAALRKVEEQVLLEHARRSLLALQAAGDAGQQERLEELVAVLARYGA